MKFKKRSKVIVVNDAGCLMKGETVKVLSCSDICIIVQTEEGRITRGNLSNFKSYNSIDVLKEYQEKSIATALRNKEPYSLNEIKEVLYCSIKDFDGILKLAIQFERTFYAIQNLIRQADYYKLHGRFEDYYDANFIILKNQIIECLKQMKGGEKDGDRNKISI